MAELLLELFSEEIPARMQASAKAELINRLVARLNAAHLLLNNKDGRLFDGYVTPRRLTFLASSLADRQPDLGEERRGPRADAPEKAIEGFKSSLPEGAKIEEREEKKGTFLYATFEQKGWPTAEVIAEIVPEIIRDFPWPKSMRWGDGDLRWVRPLHGILCILDGEVVPFEVDGLQSGNQTWGHRFHAPNALKVKSFEDYTSQLEGAKVIVDSEVRAEKIEDVAGKLARDAGLELVYDRQLVEENAGLTEWPVPLLGSFDEGFLEVPPEVLAATMKTNQKYFNLRHPDGSMANRFICVANLEADDGGTAITRGNERVLDARLSDAKFFWDQDRKADMEADWLPQLADVVFHEKLGTLADKAERMAALAKYLAPFTNANADKAERAAKLAKTDLVSGMVGEFPEVQGIMGGYYAEQAGEDPAVAQAISEHYRPQGPNDACPSAPESVAVALADKIDTLVGFFGIDEKPTGSKDPYALRRAALGAIRLIVENDVRMHLFDAFRSAYGQYRLAGVELGEHEVALLDFFADRLKVQQREKGVRHDLIDAVFALTGEDDFVGLLARVDALRGLLETDDGANLLAGYRRAANIVRIEEKKDGCRYDGDVDYHLLKEAPEKDLYEKLGAAEGEVKNAILIEDFADAMRALATLRAPVDAFFDHVTVNTDDPALRENRLNLLNDIRAAVHTVADFSKIEG